MPRFIIHHVTKYTYAEPVKDSANQIMLFPVKDHLQEVQQHHLSITGNPKVEIFKDYYGNEMGAFTNIAPHKELRIDSTITIVTKPVVLPVDDAPIDSQWKHLEEIRFMVPFIDFLKQERFDAIAEVQSIAAPTQLHNKTVYQAAIELNSYVYENFKYIKGITSIETTLDEIWKLGAGVCQDFAHILLVMLRMLHIPARYVSGYVCPHDHNLRGEGATHAWVEAYIPFYGWLGLDPTNNCVVSDLHVRLAIGRSFTDCSPVKGTYKGTARQTLEVGVSVSHEDGLVAQEVAAILTPQTAPPPLKEGEENSYHRYMQMVQQQQ
ncbi:MAG: transglutaminase family protein [Ferruginibacter sp.]